MANHHTNYLRFVKKAVVRAYGLCKQAEEEFGFPNSFPGELKELTPEQLLDWAKELTTRLQKLQQYLSYCVLSKHQEEKALELLQQVEKLARSWRGGSI